MTYSREREDALAQDAMTQGEYNSTAISQYSSAHGADSQDCAWILSPFDSWERNPFYSGPAQPHPEDGSQYYDDEFIVEADDNYENPF
jgi:hypothetical protein